MTGLFYKWWWKYLTVAIILTVLIIGLLMPVPDLPVLRESIRNTYFHIPMWFGLTLLLLVSLVYSISYLSSGKMHHDRGASSFAHAALMMGFLGLATGTVWGVYTWAGGDWSNTGWIRDPKILGAALAVLVYLAYFVLRGSLVNPEQRARVSAVYNIFGYAMAVVFMFVMPRLSGVDSLHPGSGGNPAFSNYDLDNHMRAVFIPAIIGWTLLGAWMASLRYRALQLQFQED